MSMEMPKDAATLDPRVVESRAEVLMAMDVLMKHLNDENDQEYWLSDGVPDGAPPLHMTQEQLEYYSQFADDFEEMVKVFARVVRQVCFKVHYKLNYEPGGFC